MWSAREIASPKPGGRRTPWHQYCAQLTSLPVSLDTSVSLLRADSLPSCLFLVGLSLPMGTAQEEMCSNLRPCMGWAQADGLRPTLLNQQCSWVKLSRACGIRNRTEVSLGFVQPRRERFSVLLPFCLPCPTYPQQLLS